MLDQQQRDEKSIHIFIGLLLRALWTAVGLCLLWIADQVPELDDDLSGDLARVVLAGAVLAAGVYAYRHRRA